MVRESIRSNPEEMGFLVMRSVCPKLEITLKIFLYYLYLELLTLNELMFDPSGTEVAEWLIKPEEIIQQLLRYVNVNVIIDIFLLLTSET